MTLPWKATVTCLLVDPNRKISFSYAFVYLSDSISGKHADCTLNSYSYRSTIVETDFSIYLSCWMLHHRVEAAVGATAAGTQLRR